MSLYHELRRRKDWNEIVSDISNLGGGSSGVDLPQYVSPERLKVILCSVPEPFPYYWNCLREHKELSKKQQKAINAVYEASGRPITIFQIREIMIKASSYSEKANKKSKN